MAYAIAKHERDAAESRTAGVANWSQIISSIRSIEVLMGTRIRVDRFLFGRKGTQELEVKTIECPRRLRLAYQPDLHYELDELIDVIYGSGCRMVLIFRSRAETLAERALQPLMTSLTEITLHDALERDLSDFANAVTPQCPAGKQRRAK